MSELVGLSEIADRAGVAYGTVRQWRYRHPDFPKPIAELSAGPVWDWTEVAEWIKQPRPTGRPARKEQA